MQELPDNIGGTCLSGSLVIWSAAIYRRFSVKASAFTTLVFTVFTAITKAVPW